MKLEGGCYCGALRYEADGDPVLQGQCHCRECQYFSGGGPNYVVIMPEHGFKYTKGAPASFTRSDIENPVTRYFCGACGTAIGSHAPALPDTMIIKVGTLDDPSIFQSSMAIFTCDKQPFHMIPDDLPAFEHMPG